MMEERKKEYTCAVSDFSIAQGVKKWIGKDVPIETITLCNRKCYVVPAHRENPTFTEIIESIENI